MSVQVFENFLDDESYEGVVNYAHEILRHGGNNFTTNKHWAHDILKDSAPVFIHNINQSSFAHLKLKKIIEDKTEMKLKDNNIMIYYWNRYSYIPWHNDYTYDGAITVYLNKNWLPDYGGYFLYTERTDQVRDEKQGYLNTIPDIKAIIPRKNLGVLQKNKIHHCTTAVNFAGDIRLSIQAFLENPK